MHQFSFCRHRPAFRPRRTVKYFRMPKGARGRKSGCVPLLTLCLVAGILLGAWLSSAALGRQEGNFISYYAAELLRVRCSSVFWQVFSSSLFSSFLCLSLLLLFAFSCFGAPCVIGLLWVEGCAFGAMNAALYGQMGTKGLFASAVLFLVPESVRFVCFTLTARRALQTSASLFAAQFLAREMHAQTGACALRIYMAASIACMASAFLAGALCSIFCPVFLN